MYKICKRMLAMLLCFCMIAPWMSLRALALTENTCGPNATWAYADGVLTIRGTGATEITASTDSGISVSQPWDQFRGSITRIVVEPGITVIGDSTFYNMYSVTSVSLPDSLTEIGPSAFMKCDQLTSINTPCEVTSFGDFAFADCTQLVSVYIDGSSVLKMGRGLFRNDSSLTTIEMCGRPVIIPDSFFEGCSSLRSFEISDVVSSIGHLAFSGAVSLDTIEFQGHAPEIADDAFTGVTATASYYAYGRTWTEDVLQNYGGNLTWNAIYISAPSIVTQPASLSAVEGEKAVFTISSEGTSTYQWQVSKDSGNTWLDCTETGWNTRRLELIADSGSDGWQFRCVVSNEKGSATSNPAVLTVELLPKITAQPKNVTAAVNATARFEVAAENAVSYQWQVSSDSGSTWTDCQGNDAALELTADAASDGWQYRCVLSNDVGSVTSDPATLTVKPLPVITVQPRQYRNILLGDDMTYSVTAENATDYQWQLSKDKGKTWQDCGSNSPKVTISTDSVGEWYIRCRVSNEVGNVLSNVAHLTIVRGIEILAHPQDVAVKPGTSVTLSVRATGVEEYQWEASKDGGTSWYIYKTGTSATTVILTATEDYNGWKFRCALSNAVMTMYSQVATLTVKPLPVITEQPKATSVTAGAEASFSVTASDAVSYQWQVSKDKGTTWTDCGTDSPTLTVKTSASSDGWLYRCVVSNEVGSATSNAATLTVMRLPEITEQPRSVTVAVGTTNQFSVAATDADEYQWQVSKDKGATWTDCGTNAPTLEITAEADCDGNMYRCIVSNEVGASTSNEVTLTVKPTPTITSHPQSVTAAVGTTNEFSVAAANVTEYQWQVSKDKGVNWTDCGANSPVLAVTANAECNGWQYRCVVSNEVGSATSNAATLTVMRLPKITEQPRSVTAAVGTTNQFSVAATDADSYQWQVSKDKGATWTDCGINAPTLEVTAELTCSGWQYRCRVYNDVGSAVSNVVVLTVKPLPVITAQLADAAVVPGTKVSFEILANNATEYQWQVSKDSGTTWTDCGTNSPVLAVTANAECNGWQYRCVVSNEVGTVTSDAATLTVKPVPSISQQPGDAEKTNGVEAVFRITAEYAENYQWQKSTDAGATWVDCGENTPVLRVSEGPEPGGCWLYRCVVSNEVGSVTSSEAKLTVRPLPEITSGPESIEVLEGETAKFTVTARYADSYQWEVSKDGGTNWEIFAGTKSTLEFTAGMEHNGWMFRCVVSGGDFGTVSRAATLTVKAAAPVITKQPVDKTAAVGEKVVFTIEATNATAYQWQWSDNGTTWTNCGSTGYNTPTFSFTAAAAFNNRQYRCKVSNSSGTTISNVAKLTVTSTAPTITTQPKSVTANVGEKVVFSVTASNATAYQWQWSSNGTTWNNCGSTGYNTDTFSFNAAAAFNNRQYRCKVSNGSTSVYTNTATLTVNAAPAPTITTQPKSVSANVGEKVIFTIKAANATAYQWQWSSNGTTWNNCGSTGYNTDTFSFNAAAAFNNRQYRCKVSNGGTTVYSDTAKLTVTTAQTGAPVITGQPKSITVGVGERAAFSVTATNATAYQWQWSSNGTTWTNCGSTGYNTANFSFAAIAAYNNRQYRCRVSNGTNVVFSNVATLTVSGNGPVITSQPKSITVSAGAKAAFSVVASGATSYQWQWSSNGTTWTNCGSTGYNTANFSFTAVNAYNGRMYRCKVTNSGGTTISNVATLTVKDVPVITKQPGNLAVAAGEMAIFTVTANNATTYQWQWSSNGTTWTNCGSTGCKTNTFRFTAISAYNGRQYRCIVGNANGSVISSVGRLTVG